MGLEEECTKSELIKLSIVDVWCSVAEIRNTKGRKGLATDNEFNFWFRGFDASDIQLLMFNNWHSIYASRM